ncbi:hypothetical protein HMPREF1508_0726 [Shuttleworthella sp. MSX8B]|uniref:hypothetical protein n=1 Tax=Shuttleworthella sp. MSX8B TaxID=936574 RepID=UPI00044639F1|nr:hypothetical protein [Shuttleworthia sp. MSX8B]EUB17456.1 hypothetical protein HMPREF1508_0726 [Shuttleworthia sp. MSX8B]
MILLLILKWTGIILLALLLFLFACLLYLVIFPMHIRASGEGDSRDKSLDLRLSVRGFLYFLGLDLVRATGEEEASIRVSLLWGLLTLYQRPKAVRRKEPGEQNPEDKVLTEKVTGQTSRLSQEAGKPQKKEAKRQSSRDAGNTEIQKKQEIKEEISQPVRNIGNIESQKKLRKKTGSRRKESGQKESISDSGAHSGKGKDAAKKIRSILSFIRQEESKKSLKFLWKRLKKLLRGFHLRLRDTRVTFDLDDPQNTAYLAGLLSLLPVIYQKNVSIRPDFVSEEIYLSGVFCLRMRLALRSFLWAAIRIFLNRDCRKSYHRIKEILDE